MTDRLEPQDKSSELDAPESKATFEEPVISQGEDLLIATTSYLALTVPLSGTV